MKFAPVRDLRNRAAGLREELETEGEIVITLNGRPVALLTKVDETDLEDAVQASRRYRAAKAVSRLRREASRSGSATLTPQEIEEEIRAARHERQP